MKRVLVAAIAVLIALPLAMRFRGLDHGTVRDGTYYNRHLRMGVAVPDGWFPVSREEILGQIAENYKQTYGIEPEQIESKRAKVLFLMAEGPPGVAQAYRGSLMCEARKIGYPGGIASVRHHLATMGRAAKQSKHQSQIVREAGEARIGNVDGLALFFEVWSAEPGPGGMQTKARVDCYAFATRGWSVMFIAAYSEDERAAMEKALASIRVRE